MITTMALMSLLSSVFCQYQRAHSAYNDNNPQQYFYNGPVTHQPQRHSSSSYGPAPVHFVDIGTELAGDYKFGYDTGNGADGQSFREETDLPDGTVQGSYGYTDETGKQRIVKYIAGKEGYKVLKDDESTVGKPATARSVPTRVSPPAAKYEAPSYSEDNEMQLAYSHGEAGPMEIVLQRTNKRTSRQQSRRNGQRQTYRSSHQQPPVAVEPALDSYAAPRPQVYSAESTSTSDPQRNLGSSSDATKTRSRNQPSPTGRSTLGARSRSYPPEARLASQNPPQSRSRNTVTESRGARSQVPPRRRYVPRPAYDYEEDDVFEKRRLAPIDTALLSYNIGTSHSDQCCYIAH